MVDLERGPLSLVCTIEELLERRSSGSGLEKRDYGRRGSDELTTRHPFIRKMLALTSRTSGGRSVGIVLSRTQATEFVTKTFLGWSSPRVPFMLSCPQSPHSPSTFSIREGSRMTGLAVCLYALFSICMQLREYTSLHTLQLQATRSEGIFAVKSSIEMENTSMCWLCLLTAVI
jgi:hypothetical protein